MLTLMEDLVQSNLRTDHQEIGSCRPESCDGMALAEQA